MLKKMPKNCIETTFQLAFYRSEEVYQEILAIKNRLSMLHSDAMILLYHFGCHTQKAILEIGPYIGGSTIAAAKGIIKGIYNNRVISVEIGGAFDHPDIPSDDIVSDLNKNLVEYKVRHLVEIIEGNSRDALTIENVRKKLEGETIGLFIIDSDGFAGKDIEAYIDLLAEDCFFFIDDYLSPGNIEKGNITKSHVDFLVENHFMECLGIYGWGTWIGKRTGRKFPESFNEKK